MNAPAIFKFHSSEVRTTLIEGNPWFVANDIANSLGYANPSKAISDHVDQEDRAALTIRYGSQDRKVNVLNESGMYSLVLRSKKPEAKPFKRWVTSEVLPQIRKTGQYTLHAGLPPEQQRLAQNAVAKLHGATGETFQAIWSSVKDQFKVGTYKDIPTGQFDELMLFLKSPPKPKAIPDKVGNMHRTDYCAAWLDIAAERYKKLRQINDNLYDMSFGQIRGELGRVVAELYDSIHEPKYAIARIDRNQIESKTKRMLGNQRIGG